MLTAYFCLVLISFGDFSNSCWAYWGPPSVCLTAIMESGLRRSPLNSLRVRNTCLKLAPRSERKTTNKPILRNDYLLRQPHDGDLWAADVTARSDVYSTLIERTFAITTSTDIFLLVRTDGHIVTAGCAMSTGFNLLQQRHIFFK